MTQGQPNAHVRTRRLTARVGVHSLMLERASQSGFSSGNRRYRARGWCSGPCCARRPRETAASVHETARTPSILGIGRKSFSLQPTRSALFAFSDDSRVIISNSAYRSAGVLAPCRPSGLTVGQNILFSSA